MTKEQHALRVKNYTRANKGRIARYQTHGRFQRQYKITVETYFKLLEEQLYRCAICRCHQSDVKRAFSVDHDHKTGKVRALLCTTCNSWLGIIENDSFNLRAQDYLKSH